jgi:hypothetical protein
MSLYGYRSYFINEDNTALIPPTEEVKIYVEGDSGMQVVFNILFNSQIA